MENSKRIALLFEYDKEVIHLVKQINGRKWSVSNKFWYIPYTENYLENLNNMFPDKIQFIQADNKARKKRKYFIALEPTYPPEFIETLKLKRYSEPTIKSYKLHFNRFLRYYKGINPEKITKEQIREFLLYLVNVRNYSVSGQNQAINAIKFYYEKVLEKPVEKYYVPRPRKPKKTT